KRLSAPLSQAIGSFGENSTRTRQPGPASSHTAVRQAGASGASRHAPVGPLGSRCHCPNQQSDRACLLENNADGAAPAIGECVLHPPPHQRTTSPSLGQDQFFHASSNLIAPCQLRQRSVANSEPRGLDDREASDVRGLPDTRYPARSVQF